MRWGGLTPRPLPKPFPADPLPPKGREGMHPATPADKYGYNLGLGMDASDAHLESALEEYNDRVNKLELSGPSEDLLDAYVNRGIILYMMEYRTSAMDDLESAAELMDQLGSAGVESDPGAFVRIHSTMASIIFDQEGDCTGEYALVSRRLGELNQHSRHFDRRSIVRMCIDSCKNLIDSEAADMTPPFIDKGMSMLNGHDAWSENRRVELLALNAEADVDQDKAQEAVELYSQAIEAAMALMDRGQLEDPEELVMCLVMRAEAESGLGLIDLYISDMESALTLLEHMMEYDRVSDPEVVVRLHHDVADALMKAGRIEAAEKHMVKAMQMGIRGAGDRMDIHGPGR